MVRPYRHQRSTGVQSCLQNSADTSGSASLQSLIGKRGAVLALALAVAVGDGAEDGAAPSPHTQKCWLDAGAADGITFCIEQPLANKAGVHVSLPGVSSTSRVSRALRSLKTPAGRNVRSVMARDLDSVDESKQYRNTMG